MQKSNKNLFANKFQLLDSQEHSEVINWSSSESDYENINTTNTNCRRKRKRIRAPKNISSLNITITDVPKDTDTRTCSKSPIINFSSTKEKSPILTCTVSRRKSSAHNSPILTTRNQKSPILSPRENTPKIYRAKKNLFNTTIVSSNAHVNTKVLSTRNVNDSEVNESEVVKLVSNPNSNVKLSLVHSLQTFFNSHFSSSTSQSSVISISDNSTPPDTTRTSEEILTCCIENDNSSPNKSQNTIETKEVALKQKKVRYKKNGLSYRLSNLLRKHNANISLWQHERYLAENSNFVIPKMEHSVFCIQKVHMKYGCHLIEAVDDERDNYIIVINNCYVTRNISNDSVLKLLKPYRVFEFSIEFKLITNVFKFECLTVASTHP